MTHAPEVGAVPEWTQPDRLRKARETAGLTQAQLAQAIGVSQRSISAYESGASAPKRPVVLSWSFATAVPYEWLRTGYSAPSDGPGGGLLNSDRYSSLRGVSVLTPRTHRTLVAA